MTKRQRADSLDGMLSAASSAFAEIVPPSNVLLDAADLPFFASVIAEFARADWSAHQLELAAMLARTMCDLEREQRELRAEGAVVVTEKGTPIPNPRKTVVQMHSSTILSMRRSLSIHGRGQGGEKRDVDKRRGLNRETEAAVTADDDDLLASPN